uniref:C2H2-type domain-containing protein n=1 Tax=Clastoptera arizonana TaxID=38151 RepID=A0A1B6CC12_9HEMI
MDRGNTNSTQQIIHSAVPVQLSTISRVDLPKLTPASVGVHTEEDTGPDLIDAQYINIHRVPESLVSKSLVTSALSGDLLGHHVVDLGGTTDFSQHAVASQYYDTDDLLTHDDLNDDDRRLAAALVAVQLVQQQKQQQHPTVLTTDLLGTKPITTQLNPVSTVNMDKPEMAAIVGLTNCYIQSVEEEAVQQHLLEEQHSQDERIMKLYQSPQTQQELKLQPLPPLKKVLSSQSMVIRNKYVRPVGIQNIVENQTLEQQLNVIPDEITNVNKTDVMNLDEEIDSDYDVEIRSSRRSLPHKKRIPKKLKAPPARNIHAKCYKCNKCGESFTSQAAFTTHRATHSVPTKRLPATTTFSCELCNKLFSSQIKFFEHLKSHYEPLQPAQLTPLESSPSVISLHNVDPSPTIEDTFTLKTEVLPSQEIKEEVVSTSTLPCPQCGKHFRRQKALETHVSITHSTQEHIEEFSEPEDMMEGIRHVVNIQGADSGEEDNCEDKMRQWKYGEVQEMGMNLQEMCLGLAASESDSEKTKSRRNKQLSCTVCNRSFNHRNSLLYHVRSHSGQRPHQCDVCGKSFFCIKCPKSSYEITFRR